MEEITLVGNNGNEETFYYEGELTDDLLKSFYSFLDGEDDITAEEETSAPVVAPLPNSLTSDTSSDPMSFLVPENAAPVEDNLQIPEERIDNVSQDDMPLSSVSQAPVEEELPQPDVQTSTQPLFGEDYAEKRENPDLDPAFLSDADQKVIEMTQQRNDDALLETVEQTQETDTEVSRPEDGPDPIVIEEDTSVPDTPEPVVELLDPTLEMYDAIDDFAEIAGADEDDILAAKAALYLQYAEHPLSKVSRNNNGDIIKVEYNGAIVPEPTDGAWEGMQQFLKAGVTNAVYNLGETAMAVADWARSSTLEEDEKLETVLVEEWQRDNAKYETDSMLTAIGLEGTGMVVGGGAAAKGFQYITNGIRAYKSGKFLQAAGTFLAFEGGAAATMSSDTSALVLGADPMLETPQKYFPLLEGFKIGDDTSPEEYERVMNAKLNLITEAAMLTKPAQWTIEGVGWGAYMVHSFTTAPLLGLLREGSQKDIVVRQISEKLAGVTDAITDEDKQAVLKQVVDLIEANKKVFVPMGDVVTDVEYSASTMAALERALANDDSSQAIRLIQQARSIERGAISRGATRTQIAANRPLEAVDQVVDESEAVFGGQPSVDYAADEIRLQGQLEVDRARQPALDLEAEIVENKAALKELYETDPEIGAAINKLSNDVGFDISAQSRNAEDGIVSGVTEAYEVVKGERERLYDAIQGGPFTGEMQTALVSRLREIDPARLDIAAKAMPDGPLKTLLEMAQQPKTTKVVDGKTVQKTAEEIAADEAKIRRNIMSELQKAGITDFGEFYRQIRSPIASVKNDLFNAGQAGGNVAAIGAGRTFDEFVKFVDDIEGGLLSMVDPTIQDAVAAAKQFDRDIFVPNFRQGPLKKVAELYEASNMAATVGKSDAVPLVDQYQVGVRETILPSLANNTREYGTRLVGILEGTGQNANAVKDYIVYKSLEPIGARLRLGGEQISEMELGQIVQGMQEYSAILKGSFPDASNQIDALIQQVINSRNKSDVLQTQLELAQKNADAVADRIFKQELSDFYKSQGIPEEIGQNAFNKLFKGGVTSKFENVVDRVMSSNNPLLVDGLKAAMMRNFDESFRINVTDNLSQGQLSSANIRKAQRALTPIFDQMDIVFKDSPEFVAGVQEVLNQGGIQMNRRNGLSSPLNSATAEKQQAINAVNTMVNVVIGPLNRTGARFRALGTNVVTRTLSPEKMADVMDTLLADPDEFVRVARRVFDNDTPMDPLKKTILLQYMIRSGLYVAPNASDGEFEFDLDNWVDTALQTEAMLRETASEAAGTLGNESELLRQMEEAGFSVATQ